MNGLRFDLRLRLSLMMFLQYAFNGIWVIPLGSYLSHSNYTGAWIGSVYGTQALGCIIAPFFVGMIADRFFAAEKVLMVLNILGAGLLFLASGLALDAQGNPQPWIFWTILFAHFLCYMPTWALTNTIALAHIQDPGKQFPGIRVMGTIGWIVVSAVTLFSQQVSQAFGASQPFERTHVPMILGAAIGLLAGLFAFFLPHTPPRGKGQEATWAEILGLKALALFKDPNFRIFALCSFLVFFPAMFYWAFCNMFLNEIGMEAAAFKQSMGQMAELVFLLIMPFFFTRFGVKPLLLIGMLAWIARFLCFGFGGLEGPGVMLLYLGLLLHGVCFDFFFVTGQLYTDRKAPKTIQAQAQGLISLITFGAGWFIGSNLAGWVIGGFAQKDAAGQITHNWRAIWLIPAGLAIALAILFMILFKDKSKVVQAEGQEGASQEPEGEAEGGLKGSMAGAN